MHLFPWNLLKSNTGNWHDQTTNNGRKGRLLVIKPLRNAVYVPLKTIAATIFSSWFDTQYSQFDSHGNGIQKWKINHKQQPNGDKRQSNLYWKHRERNLPFTSQYQTVTNYFIFTPVNNALSWKWEKPECGKFEQLNQHVASYPGIDILHNKILWLKMAENRARMRCGGVCVCARARSHFTFKSNSLRHQACNLLTTSNKSSYRDQRVLRLCSINKFPTKFHRHATIASNLCLAFALIF